MKCSQCGATEFTEKKVLVQMDIVTDSASGCHTVEEVSLGDGIQSDALLTSHKSITNNQKIKACVCKKCGHIEFFVK